MGEETNERFEREESSQQAEHSNEEVPEYFLKFQELMMTNNQSLNMESMKQKMKNKRYIRQIYSYIF